MYTVAAKISTVPIGAYTRELFQRFASDPIYGSDLVGAIRTHVANEENQVKAIIAKLILGEIDAGIVYQADLIEGNNVSLQFAMCQSSQDFSPPVQHQRIEDSSCNQVLIQRQLGLKP